MGYALLSKRASPNSLAFEQAYQTEGFKRNNEVHSLRGPQQSVHYHRLCGKGNVVITIMQNKRKTWISFQFVRVPLMIQLTQLPLSN